MPRRVVVIAAAVFCVAFAAIAIPFLTRSREVIASTVTPRALFGITPITLEPQDEACDTTVAYDRESQVARFGVQTHGKPGPPLELIASAPGYHWVTKVPGGYGDSVALDEPINVPAHAVRGRFCWRNAGRVPVDINGTVEPRTQGRSATIVNGKLSNVDLTLSFLERAPHSIAARRGEVVRHAGVFVPGGTVVAWIALLLAVLGIPLGSFAALRFAAADDATAGGDD